MNNPNDLISRIAAIEAYLDADPEATFTEILDSVSTVDAVPVTHGQWIEKRWFTECDWCVINHRVLVCTACNVEINDGEQTPYCPYCGAKMDKEK